MLTNKGIAALQVAETKQQTVESALPQHIQSIDAAKKLIQQTPLLKVDHFNQKVPQMNPRIPKIGLIPRKWEVKLVKFQLIHLPSIRCFHKASKM